MAEEIEFDELWNFAEDEAVKTVDEIASEIAEAANECCGRCDGFEQGILDLTRGLITQVVDAERERWSLNIMHEISKDLSLRLAKALDQIILTAINQAIGFDWTIETLIGRMDFVQQEGIPGRTYRLDGLPILRIRDQEFDGPYQEASNMLKLGFEYQFLVSES